MSRDGLVCDILVLFILALGPPRFMAEGTDLPQLECLKVRVCILKLVPGILIQTCCWSTSYVLVRGRIYRNNVKRMLGWVTIRKDEILPLATTWMDLDNNILSEISQKKLRTIWFHSYVGYKTETLGHRQRERYGAVVKGKVGKIYGWWQKTIYFGWWTIYISCIIDMYTWNLYNCINQCHPKI